MFGVELMKGRLSNLPPDYDYDPIATFDNFPKAMLSLFQILTTSNWHDIMFKYIEVCGPTAPYLFLLLAPSHHNAVTAADTAVTARQLHRLLSRATFHGTF